MVKKYKKNRPFAGGHKYGIHGKKKCGVYVKKRNGYSRYAGYKGLPATDRRRAITCRRGKGIKKAGRKSGDAWKGKKASTAAAGAKMAASYGKKSSGGHHNKKNTRKKKNKSKKLPHYSNFTKKQKKKPFSMLDYKK